MSDGMSDSSCYKSEEKTYTQLGDMALLRPITVWVRQYRDGFEVEHHRLGIRFHTTDEKYIPERLKEALQRRHGNLLAQREEAAVLLRLLGSYLP